MVRLGGISPFLILVMMSWATFAAAALAELVHINKKRVRINVLAFKLFMLLLLNSSFKKKQKNQKPINSHRKNQKLPFIFKNERKFNKKMK